MTTIKFEGEGSFEVLVPDAIQAHPQIVYIDRPVDKIVYIDKPVERIVYIDRPVYTTVEKPIYVDRPTPPQVIHRVHNGGPIGWWLFILSILLSTALIAWLVNTDNQWTVRRGSFTSHVQAEGILTNQIQDANRRANNLALAIKDEIAKHNTTKATLAIQEDKIAELQRQIDNIKIDVHFMMANITDLYTNDRLLLEKLKQYQINTRWLGAFSKNAWIDGNFNNVELTVIQTPYLDEPGLIQYRSNGQDYFWTWNDSSSVSSDGGLTSKKTYKVGAVKFNEGSGLLEQLVLLPNP